MNPNDKPEPDDDQDYDQLWDSEAEDDDALDAGEPSGGEPPASSAASPDPDPASEAPDGQRDPDDAPPDAEADPAAENQEIEALKQKLRSAEGRFSKFEEHIDGLKSQLSELEGQRQPAEAPAPEPEPELTLPDGWSKEDWEDFSADNPAQAELLQTQTRQVQQLRETVEASEQQRQQQEAMQAFRSEILAAHSDYDEVLATQRDDIVSFINAQANPVLKSAYQAIYERGSASEVASLMTDYKASRASPDKAPVDDRRVDDALAVPGRSAVPAANSRSGAPDKDDYDGSWDYFPDESID